MGWRTKSRPACPPSGGKYGGFYPCQGTFFCESSAEMRLFENLGIWVDFFNGANKMHPSREIPIVMSRYFESLENQIRTLERSLRER